MPKTWSNWSNTEIASKEGGQGRVFFVRNTERKDDPVRALKELKNPKRHERFQREIDAMRTIGSHPHVVEIIDFGIFTDGKDKPYYVMEVADASLGDAIASLRGNHDRIFEIFRSICDGVSFIHSKGIVHRDLKPENLLFFGDQVKVADLGLCLVVDENRLTEQSEAVGPRFYMAPELEDGKRLEVDSRCDVYSLAKVLYFLLSGGKVFAREKFDHPEFNLFKLLDDKRFKLFDPVFRKALNIQPKMRYSSVAELSHAVDEAVVRFNEHALSTLPRKFTDPIAAFVENPKSVVAACDLREIEQLLRLLQNTALNGESLACLTGSLDGSSVELFLALLTTNAHRLTHESLSALVTDVLRKEDLCRIVLRSAHGKDQWRSFVELVLNGEDRELLNNVARSGFLFLRHNPALAEKIASRIDQLTPEARKDFLMECVFSSFEVKLDVFRRELARNSLSSIDRELAIAGVAASSDHLSVEALCEIANNLPNVDEMGEFLRAMALTPVARSKSALLADRINNPDEEMNRRLKIGLEMVAEANKGDLSEDIASREAEEL